MQSVVLGVAFCKISLHCLVVSTGIDQSSQIETLRGNVGRALAQQLQQKVPVSAGVASSLHAARAGGKPIA